MTKFTKIFSFLIFLCVAQGIAVGVIQALSLPEQTLTAKEIQALFSDQTVAARSVDGKSQEMVIYFGPHGQVEMAKDGRLEQGKWTVREDDRLCINMEKSARDCRIIVKNGSEYRQLAVKLDGNHRHELNYVAFRKGEALAQMSESPLLPRGTLDQKEVLALFSGKTVESVTANKGRISHSYYNKDGRVDQLRNGKTRSGTWRVTNQGRMCLQMEDMAVKCRIIVKDGDEYKKYIVRKNGDHQHSVSYRKFRDGKHL